VELASGERLRSDIVVSNADSAWTHGRLLPAAVRSRWSDRRLARMRYSMSLFVWYFGTRCHYPQVGHHTILVGPRYRGLIADIFDRHVLSEDFSLYLHRPSASDPSVAPPGCDAFYVLSPVPNLSSGLDWSALAESYRRSIAERLSEVLLPNLERNIVTSRIMTPQDFNDRLLSYRGAAFGMEPTLTQSAWFRPHNQCEDIERLYLVGAGTHPGAGLPGVLSSARILDAVVPHGRSFA
jgi:phytoene desaturase